jgi:NADH dehydrogenase [ubiquinone] 1 alpha subcomplex assembly factor 3
MYLLWRPRTMAEVTPESLVFLEMIKPAPQVLVLGCGVSAAPLPGPVAAYLKARGIATEVLDSVRVRASHVSRSSSV